MISVPVDIGDVGVGDNDAVPPSLQTSGKPQRIQVVLVDDVSDGILPQQLFPAQAGGGAYVGAEGDVTGLSHRLAIAILQHATVIITHLCDLIGVSIVKIRKYLSFGVTF